MLALPFLKYGLGEGESEEGDGGEEGAGPPAFDPEKILQSLKWVRQPENFDSNITDSISHFNSNLLQNYESILVNCEQFNKGMVNQYLNKKIILIYLIHFPTLFIFANVLYVCYFSRL